MIFRRAVASQMAQAVYDATMMLFDVAGEKFKATGRVLNFDGYLRVYNEADEEKERRGEEDLLQLLPAVLPGEMVPKPGEKLEEKKTRPPGRFSFGSLVKELERLEIGRPSTYAAITKNIADRGYVREEKGKVVPLPPGETLVDYLREKHPWVIDYELTRRMERFLDLVVENKETWQRFCKGVHGKMDFARPTGWGEGGGPSEAQLRYAGVLAGKLGSSIPEATLKNGRELSAWIEAAVGTAQTPKESTAKGARSGASGAAGGVRAAVSDSLGACPACGEPVREQEKAYCCSARCGFLLWKDRLARWGKKISPTLAGRLIKGRPVLLRNLVSTKDAKVKFDAKGELHNDPQYGWGIRLSFDVERDAPLKRG
jgi:predicted nucleic acid-binding Zn ribbon protein